MKKFKSLFLAAVAVVTFSLTSCNNDDILYVGTEGELGQLTIRLSGAESTRLIQAPGQAVAVELDNAYAFIVNATGGVIEYHALNVAGGAGSVVGSGTGQTINDIPSSARVFVVGNVPAAFNPAAFTTLNAIQRGVQNITAYDTATHLDAPVANVAGAVALTAPAVATDPHTVNIQVSPVIARLELHGVRASDDYVNVYAADGTTVVHQARITGFQVTGVFVDDFHPQFTWGAGRAGTMFQIGTATNPVTVTGQLAMMHDVGMWDNAAAAGGWLTARPGATTVWAYNVPATGLPRLVIRLANITYRLDSDDAGDDDRSFQDGGAMFVTIEGFTGVSAFQRGNIYRVGAANGLTFNINHLTNTPNPTDVQLTATVQILPWVLQDLNDVVLAD